jgi:hypothetical protein
MNAQSKKILLLLALLGIQYVPFGCSSCGFETAEGSRFIIADFELNAAKQRDDGCGEVNRFCGWEATNVPTFEEHVFAITISETTAPRRGLFSQSIENPFMAKAVACEFEPFTNQKLSALSISSDKPLTINGQTYDAGSELSGMMTARNNFCEQFEPLNTAISDGCIQQFSSQSSYVLLLRFELEAANNWQAITKHQFTIQLTLDDGLVFELKTAPISII